MYLNQITNIEGNFRGVNTDGLGFIEAIKYLAKNNNEFDIVLRPHPTENIKIWEFYLDGIPNVHVIKEDSITTWVKNSFAVMHNGCTTAIEALCHGIEPISFVPHYKDEFIQYVTHDISEKVYNEKDLRQEKKLFKI